MRLAPKVLQMDDMGSPASPEPTLCSIHIGSRLHGVMNVVHAAVCPFMASPADGPVLFCETGREVDLRADSLSLVKNLLVIHMFGPDLHRL